MHQIAIILPPREGFSPGASGAVGLVVQRLATWSGSAFERLVLGSRPAPGFPGVAYRQVVPVWHAWRQTSRYAGGVVRLLRADPPDLIEVHNRPEVALALAAALPSQVSLFLHNDPQGMRGAHSPAERARLVAALAGVLPVSNWLRARLVGGLPDTARVRVMPNCLDLSALPPSPAWREPLVLFAGRLVADKGADLFVDAWARAALPGWRAEMIGADRFRADSPETPFLRDLRPRAAGAGISLLGYRPHADVLAAMARAAIVVVPSRWQEPFGLTALEAMASGAALIYAGRGGLPEVAGDAGLVFDPDQPAALAEALRGLAGDPQRLAALAAQGRARAKMFDLPEAGKRLDAYRQELLER